MEHRGTQRLETERLILRPFTAEDAEPMYRNWAADAEVTKFLTWKPHENVEATRTLVALWEDKGKRPDEYQWAIELKALGEPIGSMSVARRNDEIAAAEVGYCIGRPWWGRGLTAEALRAVVRYLIREVGMNRVAAEHDVNNPNSGRVMQKAGMTKEGVLRAAGKSNRGVGDLAVYSILARELDD